MKLMMKSLTILMQDTTSSVQRLDILSDLFEKMWRVAVSVCVFYRVSMNLTRSANFVILPFSNATHVGVGWGTLCRQ